ncbi:hypothetical protein D3C73_1206310 [compost metagenome]
MPRAGAYGILAELFSTAFKSFYPGPLHVQHLQPRPWHAPVPPGHPSHVARIRRVGQRGHHCPAKAGRGSHCGGSVCRRAGPSGGAPRACGLHDRRGRPEEDHRAGAAARYCPRNRGHCHQFAGGTGSGGRGPCDADRPRRPIDHEPRGHPAPGGRDAGAAHIPLPFCRHRGRIAGCHRRRHRLPLRHQAGDVIVRQGPVRDQKRR